MYILPSELTKKQICCLALKEWKMASNLVLKHSELREELKVSFAKGISEEFKNYFKVGTILRSICLPCFERSFNVS